ncbi:MAG: preprotein translocase subunit SecG [Clostridia bacterium]|nr:preprotein translocase subunit SecG [Clostridia bacterium]
MVPTIASFIFGGILIAVSLFLVIAVLLQSSKSKGVSGTIAGGAETFFGKSKGKSLDKKLTLLTIIVSIVFGVLALVIYIGQANPEPDIWGALTRYYS